MRNLHILHYDEKLLNTEHPPDLQEEIKTNALKKYDYSLGGCKKKDRGLPFPQA